MLGSYEYYHRLNWLNSSLGRHGTVPPGIDKRLLNSLLWSEEMKGQRRQELVRKKPVPAAC